MTTATFTPHRVLALATLVAVLTGSTATFAVETVLVPNDPNSRVVLSDLTTGQDSSIAVGDKVFSMFTYTPAGNMPLAEDVNVFGIQDPNGHFGFRLQGSFLDIPGDATGSAAGLGYRVVVSPSGLQQGNRISDAHLVFYGQGIDEDPNSSVVSVDESFTGVQPALRVALSNLPNGAENTSFDGVIFDDLYTHLDAAVAIFAFAGQGADEFARATAIDFTYSQIVVPEPTTAMLMLLGASATVLGRSRRQSAN